MKRRVIYVNEFGVTPEGETFEVKASPEAVGEGLMTNEPVTLIYPDGRKLDTVEAKITPKGIARLAKVLPQEGGAA